MVGEVNEPIAIVGSACRFAGDAKSPAQLWELLEKPRDARTKIPESRFSAEGFYHPDGQYHGHSNVRHSYVLSQDPGAFDAQFFNIKPVEAKALDPQQRLLLETVYEGLEAAGIPIEKLRGSNTGVYVGLMCNDYEAMLLRDIQAMPTYHTVGTQRSIMSNRISYFFDWHGPSMTIDTACSSSLVAVHLATQALRAGESRTALACGSNLLLGPEHYIGYSKLKMLSKDGRCKMWDQDANGYARGEGVAVVVLKTLSAAIEDGDHIECIIRETGTNQDGATNGITMPSPSAQQTLIRETYAKAGLDPLKEEDRCQYFEAHGTGTPAGDPVEAEAISQAFFGDSAVLSKRPLYVGSVKTILGHTEGTAGIASILKASLALQHGCIPPNLHFNHLSPQVAPFYDNLEILSAAKEWPALPENQPRRASVNSFGFGGANAHAILESFDSSTVSSRPQQGPLFSPIVFSASSERSLVDNLGAYSRFLERHASLNISDLAYTLLQRRSALPVKVALAATSLSDLKSSIKAALESDDTTIGTRSKFTKVLGVFTGQGAQYARMGAELLEKSVYVRRIVRELDGYLAELPVTDRPSWSLEAEILADGSSSRVYEAAISQPLCTAIQIVLVELLRLANVQLQGIVGHSSGEIGAAYAAGYLCARDALYVSYYRGLYCGMAASPNGEKIEGAMLAVGTSLEEATKLCKQPQFSGRVTVAASNSSSSVTLSGDEDAISELELLFQNERKFNRRLRVDKAYHSHHMIPCAEAYLQSLKACGIQVNEPIPGCVWFSSVKDGLIGVDSKLADAYWVDNMTEPVMFSQAVNKAISTGDFDLVLEIGPHPALKGPVSQSIQEVLNRTMPYHGMLARNTDAVEATSSAMGFLWSHLDRSCIDLSRYENEMGGTAGFNVLKNLPTYQWNHDKRYWYETRLARSTRLRRLSVHPLLGDMTPDSSAHHLSWRNILRATELPWIADHQLQSQTVFPAAGYIVTALEASRSLAGESEIRLIELRDFEIHHPMVFDSEDTGIEISVSLADVRRDTKGNVRARFTYSSGIGKEPETLTLMATADVELFLGEPWPTLLPRRGPRPPNMIEVDSDRFYTSITQLGYMYSNSFRALSSLRRKLGYASGEVRVTPSKPDEEPLLVHPATLDSAIQSILLAHSYPNDGELWSLHVPTSVRRIRVNPCLPCGSHQRDTKPVVAFDSAIAPDFGGQGVMGDVELYRNDENNATFQLEGVLLVPLLSAEDKMVFSHTTWGKLQPDGEDVARDDQVTSDQVTLSQVLERMSIFFLRKFLTDLNIDGEESLRAFDRPLASYLNYARHVVSLVEAGKSKYAKKEWDQDTYADILAASAGFAETPDVKIIRVIGEQMPRVFRGETSILEHIRPNGLLDDYYVNALGLPQTSKWLAGTVGQIAHRYPRMNIIEIGAGTGGATKSILHTLGKDFLSYTFTDISTGFFENAESTFADYKNRMLFKSLDAERDPVSQGFLANSYDLVVASFVVHATSRLEQAMRNIRRLLRPGGFVVLAEITNNDQARTPFIFGTLSGWWAGIEEGRVLSPCVSPEHWDTILRDAGFSGIDTITPSQFESIHPFSVFVSQAIDDRVSFLRNPLSEPLPDVPRKSAIEDLIIVGGSTLRVARMVAGLKSTMGNFARKTTIFKTLNDVDYTLLTPQSTVLSLTELDKPVFEELTPQSFDSLKNMFGAEKTLFWVTSGRRADNPFSNMTFGFARTALCELPELRVQFLDFEGTDKIDAGVIAENLLRFQLASFWAKDEGKNSLLWSIESELVIDSSGCQNVPRLEGLPAANNRYNSVRRSITQECNISEQTVSICKGESGFLIREECETRAIPTAQAPTVQLRATHAILSALKTPLGPRFLTLAVDQSSGTKHIVFTEHLASTVQVAENALLPCDVPPSADGPFLALVAANLVSMAILDTILCAQTLVVHNPTPVIARVMSRLALEKGVNVVYTTDLQNPSLPGSYVHLPPYISQRRVRELLPKDITCFVDLSDDSYASRGLKTMITSCLAPRCRVETAATLLLSASAIQADHNDSLRGMLARAVGYSRNDDLATMGPTDTITISLGDVASGFQPKDAMTVLDWAALSSVSVPLRRFDAHPMFRADKTYWLVGLSGTLGLSLCDWMVENGARHVVISSRNPKVDSAWLDNISRGGGNVKVLAGDIADKSSLESLYETICATFPPIAGVAQGAMVLKDTAIRDMTFEQMTDVLKPKVEGSIYLDQLFANQELDFFVFFSSILGITGNMGQANYTAANTFMCSLASQRRKRGLAASVINIGVIVGAGYVTREVSHTQEEALRKGGLMSLSEKDFHQIFAEGVMASLPDSSAEWEISAGLREVSADSSYLPIWHSDPKFGRFIVKNSINELERSENRTMPSITDRLRTATSFDMVRTIIQESFSSKLRALLQLETGDDELMKMRTDEVGLDSLIAVDIRSWFLRNFRVDMPVLKILGGASIAGLVDETLQNLPEDLISHIPSGDEDPTTSTMSSSARSVTSNGPDLFSPRTEVSDVPLSSSEPKSDTESVPPRSLEKSSSLSFSQSLFWVVDSLIEDKTTLNHTVLLRISGNLRVNDLRKAVAIVGRHHEALRTCFFVLGDHHVMQGVLEQGTLALENEHISDTSEVKREFELLKNHVYELESGQVMRIRLLTLSASEHYLLIGFHHINVDGISYQILIRDLDKAYRGQKLDQSMLQYLSYSDKQRVEFESGAWDEDISFWKKEFDTIPEPLPLTRSRISTRLPLSQYAINTVHLRVDKELANHIRDVSRAHKATSFHFYLTAFQILLHRLTGVEDLSIGIADGNRKQEDVLGSIGPYLNLVPLRLMVTSAHSFGQLISETRAKAFSGLGHSQVPFDVLLKELRVDRAPTHTPIFQAFVDYRQGAPERQPFANCTLELMELEMGRTGYDMSLDVIDNAGGDMRVTLMGQKTLYSATDMQIFMDCFEDILREFVASPANQISRDWQYREADIKRALDLGRGDLLQRQWPETLIHQLESVAQKNAQKVALIHPSGASLTYSQLSQRVDSISAALLEAGILPGQYVGVFQETTLDWICSMLAILKVGAVYVPLDPGTRTSRLAMVVSDCEPTVILVDADTEEKYPELGASTATVVNVAAITDGGVGDIEIRAAPNAVAMVYYTSGSTGTPKGIATKHEGLRAVFEGTSGFYGLDSEVVFLMQSALNFDMCLIPLFSTLPLGGTVCMIPRDMRGDAVAITNYIVEQKVTHTAATPSEYTSWLLFGDRSQLQSSSWRASICGAEPITEGLLEKFRELDKLDLRLFNLYGPAETTVYTTQQELNYKDKRYYQEFIPAGYSLPNKAIYIVDEQLRLLPPGLPGEIVLAGVGVAQGYLNNDTMTKASFIPDPYAIQEYIQQHWTTMYRTKDRGRLLSDGSITVEGRIGDDTEIKLRGLRIDLKDIEQTIIRTAKGTVVEAVASIRSTAGTDTQFLVAHVVFSPDNAPVDQEAFLTDLRTSLPLPQYMCPAVIVAIDQLPMTVSGKRDRRAVSLLPVAQSSLKMVESLSDEQALLKAVWEEILPKCLFEIGMESDFFHVGGTSLLLVQLQARIHQRLGVSVKLAELFASSTLQAMANLVGKKTEALAKTKIDWEWETRPAADLQIGTAPPKAAPATHPKVILLTGCAGFLGRHLLKSLIDHPHVEKIYCVAVRQLEKRLATQVIPQNDRVHYYEGDLRYPRLGLSEQDANHIFSEVDAVIHNGADVSHLKSYFTLRAANLNATKELARLCLPRRVPFHYISTAGVSMFTFWQSFGEETASAAQPPTDGTNGYKASKWASERYLERLNEMLRLPMWLHRPSDMVREDNEEAQWDLLHTLLGYSRKLQAVPVSENLWGWLDLVAPDRVSNDVVQMVVDNKPRSSDGSVSYAHQTGDMTIPIDKMKEFFEEESGNTVTFEEIPMEEWARRAEAAGMKPAVAAVFGNVPHLPRALCFPRFVKTWKPEGEPEGVMLNRTWAS